MAWGCLPETFMLSEYIIENRLYLLREGQPQPPSKWDTISTKISNLGLLLEKYKHHKQNKEMYLRNSYYY